MAEGECIHDAEECINEKDFKRRFLKPKPDQSTSSLEKEQ
jgi:hypothetical protein